MAKRSVASKGTFLGKKKKKKINWKEAIIGALDSLSTFGVLWAFSLIWVITAYQVYLLV